MLFEAKRVHYDYLFPATDGILKLTFFAGNGVRVTHSPDGCEPRTLTVPRLPDFTGPVEKSEDARAIRLRAPCLTVEIEKPAERLRFFDASGKLLLAEPESGARWTEPQTIAGHALTARRQTFLFTSPDDALHGLGHQLGAGWNFRGRSLDLLAPTGLQHTGDYTGERLELRVYPGADGAFTLSEDRGDGYHYEDGEYLELDLRWHDAPRRLELPPTRSAYSGAPARREFLICFSGDPKIRNMKYCPDKTHTLTL